MTAWKQQGSWFRVTPPGFAPEAWVSGDQLQLDPSTPHDGAPDYLAKIKLRLNYRTLSETVSSCAVVVNDVLSGYDRPRFLPDNHVICGGWGLCVARGQILRVHRQEADWLEVSRIDSDEQLGWISSDDVVAYSPAAQSGRCITHLDRQMAAVRNGPLHNLPLEDDPPVSFVEVGDKLTVMQALGASWLLVRDPRLRKPLWVKTDVFGS